MDPFGKRHLSKPWRRLAACIVAYTLVLHAVLTGAAVAAGSFADSELGFARCLHGSDGATPAVPADQAERHCKFCIAAGHSALAASTRAPQPVTVAYATKLPWAAHRNHVATTFVGLDARPRGPPPSI